MFTYWLCQEEDIEDRNVIGNFGIEIDVQFQFQSNDLFLLRTLTSQVHLIGIANLTCDHLWVQFDYMPLVITLEVIACQAHLHLHFLGLGCGV